MLNKANRIFSNFQIIIFSLLIIIFSSNRLLGSEFLSISIDSAKILSASTGKLIMVDGYTDWCGWCKVLDQKTFSDSVVKDFMNKNFIPIKMNMEKNIGSKYSMKYSIKGFPTVFFLNAKGKLVYRIVGFMEPNDYLLKLKDAINPVNHEKTPGYSDNLDVDYPDFYKNYFGINGKRVFPAKDSVSNWLSIQKDFFNEIVFSVLLTQEYDNKYSLFLMDNQDKYSALFGKNLVEDKIKNIIFDLNRKAGEKSNDSLQKLTLNYVDKYLKSNDEEKINLKEKLNFNYIKLSKNFPKYVEYVNKKMEGSDLKTAEFLNEEAWTVYEELDDPAMLKHAINWIKKALSIAEDYNNLDTYACLLAKKGNKNDAIIYAKKAIDKAKQEGKKYKSTEELLEKLEKK